MKNGNRKNESFEKAVKDLIAEYGYTTFTNAIKEMEVKYNIIK